MAQFDVWKSVSATTPREEIISNFKDIAYHLKSISRLSRRGLLSYSHEERRMYSDVIQYYAGILGHVFLVSGDATSAATVERPVPSDPIPIPARVQTKPIVNANVNTYSPAYAVGDGWVGGRSSGFGGQSAWDIG